MATSAHAKPLVAYSDEVEAAVALIEDQLRVGEYGLSRRSVALLCLQGDEEMIERVSLQEGQEAETRVRSVVGTVEFCPTVPFAYQVMLSRTDRARELSATAVKEGRVRPTSKISQFVGSLCSHPILGFGILLAVLYYGLYWFVGVFGAGDLVGLLEENLFGNVINPAVTGFVERFAETSSPVHDLLVGEYGVWTLGVTYAVALILPIVFTFFLMFSILEDSGYLPRLALLVDRVFKAIGLNGRGVIPIVLGFGCDTMATVVTRILETKRERVIATFLLSLAIPCTAQLAVVTGLLAGATTASLGGITYSPLLVAWCLIMLGVFLLAGFFAAKITPGKTAPFYLELPPMRLPSVSNVIAKTLARVQWYFLEVAPLFLIASVVIWLGRMPLGWVLLLGWIGFAVAKKSAPLTRVGAATVGAVVGWAIMALTQGRTAFEAANAALEPLARLLTLPAQAAEVFLFGFFRRDYGAAGLDKLTSDFALSNAQILVIAVTITLFLPCVAQFLIVRKERGMGMAVGMLAFTLFFATAVGAALAALLSNTGWLA